VELLSQIHKHQPRILIGNGQGAFLAAMATFPIILEKACRDRAVGMTQMVQFRKAWSAVTAIIMIDPVIMPASNNVKSIPFEFMKSAYPETEWTQPQGNRRAMITTKRYMTVEFARSLSSLVGCTAESEILPGTDILTEALRPPPVYFETDEKDMSGVCCVCMKKGPLGRCPNPKCGLLMHFTCVPPSEKGRNQMCPTCRDDENLSNPRNSLTGMKPKSELWVRGESWDQNRIG
jgi:hypothetical protein